MKVSYTTVSSGTHEDEAAYVTIDFNSSGQTGQISCSRRDGALGIKLSEILASFPNGSISLQPSKVEYDFLSSIQSVSDMVRSLRSGLSGDSKNPMQNDEKTSSPANKSGPNNTGSSTKKSSAVVDSAVAP
jgi:hypothetical protein